MKVHLVTHSIIPNLNSGLVPIDPVGLVSLIIDMLVLQLGFPRDILNIYQNFSKIKDKRIRYIEYQFSFT